MGSRWSDNCIRIMKYMSASIEYHLSGVFSYSVPDKFRVNWMISHSNGKDDNGAVRAEVACLGNVTVSVDLAHTAMNWIGLGMTMYDALL